jgi:hypothetical protein
MIGPTRWLIFTTDEGQLLLGIVPELHLPAPGDTTTRPRTLRTCAPTVLQPLVEGGTRTSRVSGAVSERFFFRRAAGRGWALAGDAGHHKASAGRANASRRRGPGQTPGRGDRRGWRCGALGEAHRTLTRGTDFPMAQGRASLRRAKGGSRASGGAGGRCRGRITGVPSTTPL